jgi:hypothetical protein
MIEELLNQLKNGRTKEDFNAVKDVLLIIASNMYYDDKLTNDQYNEVCKQLCNLRDIMNKAK